MCMCNFVCKGHPWNDLYCVGRDVKPYSLTRSGQTSKAVLMHPVKTLHDTQNIVKMFSGVFGCTCDLAFRWEINSTAVVLSGRSVGNSELLFCVCSLCRVRVCPMYIVLHIALCFITGWHWRSVCVCLLDYCGSLQSTHLSLIAQCYDIINYVDLKTHFVGGKASFMFLLFFFWNVLRCHLLEFWAWRAVAY